MTLFPQTFYPKMNDSLGIDISALEKYTGSYKGGLSGPIVLERSTVSPFATLHVLYNFNAAAVAEFLGRCLRDCVAIRFTVADGGRSESK